MLPDFSQHTTPTWISNLQHHHGPRCRPVAVRHCSNKPYSNEHLWPLQYPRMVRNVGRCLTVMPLSHNGSDAHSARYTQIQTHAPRYHPTKSPQHLPLRATMQRQRPPAPPGSSTTIARQQWRCHQCKQLLPASCAATSVMTSARSRPSPLLSLAPLSVPRTPCMCTRVHVYTSEAFKTTRDSILTRMCTAENLWHSK